MTKKLPEGAFSIMNGPSKFELMLSVFEGKRVQVTCELVPQTGDIRMYPKITVLFSFIGPEDGSHDSWIGELNFCDPNYENCKRTFYYDGKTRKGTVGVTGKKFV